MTSYQSKYGVDRRSAIPRNVTTHSSVFLWTISPNIACERGSETDEKVTDVLFKLNDFLLEDDTLKSLMIFHGLKDSKGAILEKTVNDKPRQWHLDRVLKIENKSFGIEYDYKHGGKPHSHMHVSIEADTYLQFNREKIQEICGLFFETIGWPVSRINVHISGATSKGQLRYVEKMMVGSSPKVSERI